MRYASKVVVIDAIQWDGNNTEEVCSFGGEDVWPSELPGRTLTVKTHEGILQAKVSDWIIRGLIGEVYPCSDEVFQRKYQKVDENAPATTGK
jgi:hypothetical protein